MSLKKDMYFLDISGYQPADMRAMTAVAGTDKTIIKLTESTSYYNSYAVSQTNTSDCIGYYHFARFGGSVTQAQTEAAYFLSTVPKKVKYLVCDYEDDASGNRQANTNAVLAFMDKCKAAGYQPIYYSYKPFTLANVDYTQIIAKYPNSLWIAAYPNYEVTPDPVWSVFPSMEGIRWWQFTSVGIAGGLDKNVVLLDDAQTQAEKILEASKGDETMYTIGAKDRGIGVVQGGAFFALRKADDPIRYWEAGAKHVNVSTETFDEIQANATNSKINKTNDLLEKLLKK